MVWVSRSHTGLWGVSVVVVIGVGGGMGRGLRGSNAESEVLLGIKHYSG